MLHLILRKESKMIKALTFSILILTVLIFACSKDKTSPTGPDNTVTTTWVEDGGYWSTLLDASSSDNYVYFSLSTGDMVSLTDEQAADNDSWDISFMRYHINLNGGLTGTKGVVAADLAAAGSADSISFAAVVDTSDMIGHDWTGDNYVFAVDDWYLYTGPPNHELLPTNNVYVIRDAEGKYVKFQVIGLENPGMPPNMGSVVCRFVYAASGADISGDPDTVTVDIGDSIGYLDFSTAMQVTPADPMSSADWDIAFTNYEIHLNSGYFGPGIAEAYPVYQDMLDPTDFDSLTLASTNDNAYFTDGIGSVFDNWYNYIHSTNRLPSKNHVYLIKANSKVYKLQIYSYYHLDTDVDGWYTFYWAELNL